jgi:hypothetical protein
MKVKLDNLIILDFSNNFFNQIEGKFVIFGIL